MLKMHPEAEERISFMTRTSITRPDKRAIASVSALILLASPVLATEPAMASAQSDLDDATAKVKAATSAYDDAQAELDSITQQVDDAQSRLDELQTELDAQKTSAAKAVKSTYTDNTESGLLAALLGSDNISDAIKQVDNIMAISKWRNDTISNIATTASEVRTEKESLESAKTEQEQKVDEAEDAKIKALDAQEDARQKVSDEQARAEAQKAKEQQQQQQSQSSGQGSGSSQQQAQSSSSDQSSTYDGGGLSDSEESARAWIVNKESHGNYNARNGKYVGAYQLTSSYLGGDYSPAHQDEVANSYVARRYGSWSNAKAFWQSHGWY